MIMYSYLACALVMVLCTTRQTDACGGDAGPEKCKVAFRYLDGTVNLMLKKNERKSCGEEYIGSAVGCHHNSVTCELKPGYCLLAQHVEGKKGRIPFTKEDIIPRCPRCYAVTGFEPKHALTYEENCLVMSHCDKEANQGSCDRKCRVKFVYKNLDEYRMIRADEIAQCRVGYVGYAVGCEDTTVNCVLADNYCELLEYYDDASRPRVIDRDEAFPECLPCHTHAYRRNYCAEDQTMHQVCTPNSTIVQPCCKVVIRTDGEDTFTYVKIGDTVSGNLCRSLTYVMEPSVRNSVCRFGEYYTITCINN